MIDDRSYDSMIFFQMLHCMIATKHSFSAIAAAISSVSKMSCVMSFSYLRLESRLIVFGHDTSPCDSVEVKNLNIIPFEIFFDGEFFYYSFLDQTNITLIFCIRAVKNRIVFWIKYSEKIRFLFNKSIKEYNFASKMLKIV